MLFNSLDFFIFLPIVFILYWFVGGKNIERRNLILIFASYYFYGCWDYRFLGLIVISSLIDFGIGIVMNKSNDQKKRKRLLLLSLAVNLGVLGFFKYFNFFIDSFSQSISFFGTNLEGFSLNIILPVGISFYTFQTLSYTIDVYRKKIVPTKNLTAFLAFVSFFPQLVAGPIERATNLLPQFYKTREFNYQLASDGLKQILWGLFKKIVIADNCAKIANDIFNNYETLPGSTLFLGSIFFAFQIYCDFSGYSDIAIGISRLFNFDLKKNFAFPYFSRDMGEFWRRWHISLSTWFRDYLYIPLGGSRVNKIKQIRNTFIIFLVSGFWHGANWTFIIWGLINALYFIPLLLMGKNRKNTNQIEYGRIFPSFITLVKILFTFTLTCIAWIFFRADSVSQALLFLKNIFSESFFSMPSLHFNTKLTLTLVLFFVALEWINRHKEHILEVSNKTYPKWIRWTSYIGLILIIFIFGGDQQEFIYFQF
jgi:D-alanyl-lipoteichoic acid acyltransferase DltB (MBOAT superfamily)